MGQMALNYCYLFIMKSCNDRGIIKNLLVICFMISVKQGFSEIFSKLFGCSRSQNMPFAERSLCHKALLTKTSMSAR